MQPLGKNFFSVSLSKIYKSIVVARNFLFDYNLIVSHKAKFPVISIGGIHAGGTGKTPLSLMVGSFLEKKGFSPVFLSRGYKRKNKKIYICKPGEVAQWENTGDEPVLLHSNLQSSWLGIGAKRTKTVKLLDTILPLRSVYILDDGFQHRQLGRNLNVVCLPAQTFNDNLIPIGTLREPIVNLKRANCIFVIGNLAESDDLLKTKQLLESQFKHVCVFCMYQYEAGWVNFSTKEFKKNFLPKKSLLISGIARPERFLNSVKTMGLLPHKTLFCSDHHVFSQHEIEQHCTENYDAIVTTEKDACRFTTLNLVNYPEIWYLKIGLKFFDPNDENRFYSRLNGILP